MPLMVYLSNDFELIQWGQDVPQVGDPFPGGGTIASIEHYQGERESVALILSEAIAHEPDETFDVEISPDLNIIRYGWSMIGQPPVGRLKDYEPTSHATLQRPNLSRWYVDQIETCKPTAEGTYQAIYLCHCVEAPVEVAA